VITSELAANLKKSQVFLALLKSLKNCAAAGYEFCDRGLIAAIHRVLIDNVFLLEKVTSWIFYKSLKIQAIQDVYLMSHD
jgi:hypothetical protein